MKNECSKCGGEKENNRENQRYCKFCHNEYMRNNRKKHNELTELQRLKANARSYLNVYLKRGKLLKESCCKCDNPVTEAHHEDYNKPLEVIWYCRECHLDLHLKGNK